MSTTELCDLTAVDLAGRIRRGDVSAREVMEQHLGRIEMVNPGLNAIVTLLPERALEAAGKADEAQARGEALGALHGLPTAHKDLMLTKGVRTTFGSPLLSEFVPNEDSLIVERMRRAGAIMVGKTNTPEFGAGSQTFNPVFGSTRNPYDVGKTCGGSSGGAAVALASGMVPVADGSDMGGSLRNPASFCNVVGFRPSPGRVPSVPAQVGWFPIEVPGPMARTVADAALLLSTIAGPDARSPIALDEPGARFAQPLGRDFSGTRIGWSSDFGGLPVDSTVVAVLESQRDVLSALGCRVEEACPDFTGADEAFKAWRAWYFELSLGGLLAANRGQFKDTLAGNIDAGAQLSGPDLGRAERRRTEVYQRLRVFMERYEFLLLPVSQVPPFDIDQPWVEEIAGTTMASYVDWMRSCYYVTVTGHPAISVPAGFTPDGLPVGLQIVGRHHDDWGVLQLAHAFEQATGWWRRRPPLVGA